MLKLRSVSDALQVLLGGAITLAGTWVASRTEDRRARRSDDGARRRDDEARDAERQAAARAFQRETLLALQDALARLARATGAAHHATETEYRHQGEWGRAPLPEAIDAEMAAAIRDVQRLQVRVDDDEVRATARDLIDLAVRATMPAMREEATPHERAKNSADDAFQMAPSRHLQVNERIGEILRAG
jgi:hypothetical protein